MYHDLLRLRRVSRVIFALAITVLTICGARSVSAQSVWQQLKDQAKKTKEEMKQATQPHQTPQKQSGQQTPQTSRRGEQRGEGGEASVPISLPEGTRVEETVLAPLADGAKFYVSPHGVHVATFETSGSRAVMYYDGEAGPKFDEILGGGANMPGEAQVAFSPDGKRYAYCGRAGNEFVVMVDGKELMRSSDTQMGKFDGNSCMLGFTANSKHIWMVNLVIRSSQSVDYFARFYFDGKLAALPSYGGEQRIGATGPVHVSFSPDGERYAYVAIDPANQQKWALVVDGKVAPYLGGSPQWSADSQHLFTTIQKPALGGRGTFMEAMLDGKPFMRADEIKLHVSCGGSMVVAEATAGNNTPRPTQFLVVDGKKVPGSEIIHQGGARIEQITISPDGKHFAARFTNGQGRQYVFLDGKPQQEYQIVDHIAFTADSSKVTYTAFTNNKPYAIIGDQESQACLAEPLGPVVDMHGGLMLAPAGGRAGTICTLTGGAINLFIDGKSLSLPEGAESADDIRFSPDGQHYAYTAAFRGSDRRLVLDGALQMNSNLGSPGDAGPRRYVFSPDSQHIAVYSLPPQNTGTYATGIFLDGKYVPVSATPMFYRIEFTKDSRHLAWAQTVPSRREFRIVMDGKPVAEIEPAVSPGSRDTWWEMTSDGGLLILGQDDKSLKRITITPSAKTSAAGMLGSDSSLAKAR
jgi:Tol biopolymer transport system component